jgi:murein L,D-transpeptidase YcbB/YkuD
VPGFVNYKKGCIRLAAASDKVYQLLAHGWWFSSASSTTKTGRHEKAEILLEVTLNTINLIPYPKGQEKVSSLVS